MFGLWFRQKCRKEMFLGGPMQYAPSKIIFPFENKLMLMLSIVLNVDVEDIKTLMRVKLYAFYASQNPKTLKTFNFKINRGD